MTLIYYNNYIIAIILYCNNSVITILVFLYRNNYIKKLCYNYYISIALYYFLFNNN